MSESTPRISVALCTYNGASHLRAQIDSVLAQRNVDFEIVAVDDASTDDSAAILRDYAAREPRLSVVVNARRLGYNATFVDAFARCRGGWIAPCDQDDVWHAEKLAALTAAIGTMDLAYCDSELIDAYGASMHRRLSDSRRMYQGADPLALVTTNSASGHAMLFRRDLLRRAEPFPAGIHYDWWLAIVAASGHGLRYVDRPLVKFRRHAGTATGIAREASRPPPRAYLENRRQLLRAMARLDGSRRGDVEALAQALDRGLERGAWLEFARLAWRHRAALGAVLGPGLAGLAWRALRPRA